MSSSIEKLLALQNHDRRLMKLNRDLNDIPKRKEMIESRLNEYRSAVHGSEEQLKKNELKMKEIEGSIEAKKDKIKVYRKQQYEVKSNEDYRRLDQEVRTEEKSIRDLEELEIEVMEESEGVREELSGKKEGLDEQAVNVQEEIEQMDERLGAVEAQLEKARAERAELMKDIDPQWLSRYERILSNKNDFALVAVENGSCMGCHMMLPPQLAHDARKEDKMTICSYCGRILYSY